MAAGKVGKSGGIALRVWRAYIVAMGNKFYQPYPIIGYLDVYRDADFIAWARRGIGPKYLPNTIVANRYRLSVYDALSGVKGRDWGLLEFIRVGVS